MTAEQTSKNADQIIPAESPVSAVEPGDFSLQHQARLLAQEVAQDHQDLAEIGPQLTTAEELELRREIDLKEGLLEDFHRTLAAIEAISAPPSDQSADGSVEKASQTSVLIDPKKIGWLDGEEPFEVPVETIDQQESGLKLASIVEMGSATKRAADSLRAQGEWDGLLQNLKQSLPQFWQNVRMGKGSLRPISIGGRRPSQVDAQHALNTSYPAYKLDVKGTNNRALVLLVPAQPGQTDQAPVFVLAAMYDHEDQGRVLNSLFTKTK